MKKLKFAKMSGAGNDFVLLRAADLPRGKSLTALAQRLCDRRSGVGADGLLVLDKGGAGALRLSYHNADGSRAFCGNGSRCAVWYGFDRGLVKGPVVTLQVDDGALEGRVTGKERVRLSMPGIKDLRLGLGVFALGRRLTVHHVDTGVPHVVLFVGDLEAAPVESLGRALRYHKAFAPKGANVNFVQLNGKGLKVRTYERGVEAETLACGTGATASAVIAAELGKVSPPVACQTRGGDVLKVYFKDKQDVWLEGPAKVTFEGEIDV